MGELLHIPETDPLTLAERLKDPEVNRMLARHTLEMDSVGLLDIYKSEVANTRFLDSAPDFIRQDDHFAEFVVKKFLGRIASLNIDAPLLVSRETMPADPEVGILQTTRVELIKVDPLTGLVYPDSQFDVCEETEEFGIENPHNLPLSTLEMARRHYQEQIDLGIVLKGQYPKEAGIL